MGGEAFEERKFFGERGPALAEFWEDGQHAVDRRDIVARERADGQIVAGVNCAPQSGPSSPDVIGRSSIPETDVIEPGGRGVLGRPVEPGDDGEA
ncbi:hypothetical protein [Bradyrhizobium sp. DASA03120]|uniref:hypothetical protein n=1 Tax=Bradyrhizobium sp. SMVTL-02 TaxID=3395917 RepID=UPI003F715B8C